jgi:hypothetical protein
MDLAAFIYRVNSTLETDFALGAAYVDDEACAV